MAAVADNKKIRLNGVYIQIAHQIQEGKPWITSFKIKIDPGKNLTRREQTILFNSSRLCEVHKILTGEFTFDYELVSSAEKLNKDNRRP